MSNKPDYGDHHGGMCPFWFLDDYEGVGGGKLDFSIPSIPRPTVRVVTWVVLFFLSFLTN